MSEQNKSTGLNLIRVFENSRITVIDASKIVLVTIDKVAGSSTEVLTRVTIYFDNDMFRSFHGLQAFQVVEQLSAMGYSDGVNE